MSKKALNVHDDSRSKGIQGNTSKSEIKCVCLNARSIINKKTELNIMVDDIKPHIIGITESWANKDIFCVANIMKNIIVSDEFNVKAPCIAPAQDITEMEAESFTALPDEIVHEAETTRLGETVEPTLTDLEAVGNLHNEILTGKVTAEEA